MSQSDSALLPHKPGSSKQPTRTTVPHSVSVDQWPQHHTGARRQQQEEKVHVYSSRQGVRVDQGEGVTRSSVLVKEPFKVGVPLSLRAHNLSLE